jgi:iron(III) transport system ATP-binding protein
MGEAMLFDGQAQADGTVVLGPIALKPRQVVPAGAVRVAVRPEAWRLSPQGPGIEAVVQKAAYLGSVQELTLQTPLGSIFVVWPEPEPLLAAGERVWLNLSGHGVSVVPR